MHIKNIDQTQINFGRLITGQSAKEKLCSSNCPKTAINKFINYRKIIWKSGINRLEYADVILDYKDKIGYYIYAAPKKADVYTPTEENKFTNIMNSENHINKLKEWADYWNKKFANYKAKA